MVGNTMKVLSLFACLGLANVLLGQDQPAKPAGAAAATGADVAEFQKLFESRSALGKKLEGLKGQIEKAIEAKDAAKQKQLIDQFNGLVTDFETKTLPRLLELAIPIYIKDPKNAEAENICLGFLQDKYHENQYKQLIQEGNKFLAAGRNHPAILNWVGVSCFATHDFAKAEALLNQAKAAGAKDDEAAQAFSQIGAPFLGQCKQYAGWWKEEQAIRAKEAAAKGEDRLPRVLMKTDKGDIEIELFENEAPNTVANFISLVEKKKYDGIYFHRVIPNFMAQGGDPNTLDKDPRNDGMGGPGYTIKCECFAPNARRHFQGSLSMAHAGRDTGGSQFFLTHLPTGHLNPDVDQDRGHTVFGRVVKGLDAALALRPQDKINSATVIFKRNHPYVPVTKAE